MARRECVRCHAIVHDIVGQDNEHICADVLKRYNRRIRQRDAVMAVFARRGLLDGFERTKRDIAEEVVKVLANLGVEQD